MMAQAIRYDSIVPRPLRELTILRTAQLMGGHYEVHQHETAALTCGYSQSQMDALADWRPSNLFSEKERALLAYVDRAVLAKGEVDETIFAELALFFSAREIVEITIIAANYMGTAVLTNALRVRIDEPGVFAAIIP
jgi:alkylhydroperoxidase family enzyme